MMPHIYLLEKKTPKPMYVSHQTFKKQCPFNPKKRKDNLFYEASRILKPESYKNSTVKENSA